MTSLEEKIRDLEEQKKEISRAIDELNRKREIQCSCGDSHSIGDLTAIQTHWYTPPSGCTEGDYWNEGELEFCCPTTGIINRLLFDNYDVPWKERDKYDNNPAQQFNHMYRRLFKEIINTYEPNMSGRGVNNHYVDKNREKFWLVEKRKES